LLRPRAPPDLDVWRRLFPVTAPIVVDCSVRPRAGSRRVTCFRSRRRLW